MNKCALPRLNLIHTSENYLERIGQNSSQVRSICSGFLQIIRSEILLETYESPSAAGVATRNLFSERGIPLEEAALTGSVCLGLAYQAGRENDAFRLAAVVANTASAEYAEIVGHHIRNGFAEELNSGVAAAWYESAVTVAFAQGVHEILPNLENRQDILERAIIETYR